MSSNKTTNYDLPQWEKDDFIQMDDFNAAFSKIDEKLKANADAAGSKAESSALTAEQTARANAIAALTAALGSGGKTARIAWGSYTGNGTYGSSNPVALSFDFCPVLVFLGADSHAENQANPTVLINGWEKVHADYDVPSSDARQAVMTLAWSANGVSFYNTTKALYQCNTNNCVYRYVAIGYDTSSESA